MCVRVNLFEGWQTCTGYQYARTCPLQHLRDVFAVVEQLDRLHGRPFLPLQRQRGHCDDVQGRDGRGVNQRGVVWCCKSKNDAVCVCAPARSGWPARMSSRISFMSGEFLGANDGHRRSVRAGAAAAAAPAAAAAGVPASAALGGSRPGPVMRNTVDAAVADREAGE